MLYTDEEQIIRRTDRLSAGYNYYGTERLYSGVDGREMEADIFFGIVHYQRLRHMVSDKFQVRSVGPVDILTHQPVKGRKRGGGVRFGEMERDGLISHGSLYLLFDRLFNCSDQSTVSHTVHTLFHVHLQIHTLIESVIQLFGLGSILVGSLVE